MKSSVDLLVRDLRGTRDVNAHYRAIDTFVEHGEIERVVELAKAVEERRDIGAEPWALQAVYDRAVRALALCRAPRAAAAALDLGLSVRTQSTQRPRAQGVVARELAALLATGQSRPTMLAMLAESVHQFERQEVLACWIQECVVRGNDLVEEPLVELLWSRLRNASHALAVLPLQLDRIESDLRNWLPSEGVGGSSHGMPFGPSTGGNADAIRMAELVSMTELPKRPSMTKAVENWTQESNGRIEARAFRFERRVHPSSLTAPFMKALPLECVRAAAVDEIRLRVVPPTHAFSLLFSAASTGGAYNRGHAAAYGRLELWQTVAGLLGHDAPDVPELARAAEDWHWYSFDGGPWFEQVAWDLGVAALSPDGSELSILAATDSD